MKGFEGPIGKFVGVIGPRMIASGRVFGKVAGVGMFGRKAFSISGEGDDRS